MGAFQSLVSNVAILNGVLSLTGATMGLPGSTAILGSVLSQDEDDDIAEWTGTIRDLISRDGGSVVLQAGDCERLLVRVTRP